MHFNETYRRESEYRVCHLTSLRAVYFRFFFFCMLSTHVTNVCFFSSLSDKHKRISIKYYHLFFSFNTSDSYDDNRFILPHFPTLTHLNVQGVALEDSSVRRGCLPVSTRTGARRDSLVRLYASKPAGNPSY